ncbi:hypothetical protein BH11MYX1_BH11MYX1_32490 [soil metagenome]
MIVAVVSANLGLAASLAARLELGGTKIAVCATMAALEVATATIAVVDLSDPLAAAGHEASPVPVIAVSPSVALAEIIRLMQQAPRIVAVLPHDVEAIVAAVPMLCGSGVGLARHVPAGTAIHAYRIVDHGDKVHCMAQIRAFVTASDAATHFHDAIDQTIDELAMNALYDAPVDERGEHLFAQIPPRTRIRMRTTEAVIVEWARVGARVAIAVRDAFGSLTRDTALRFLAKSLHSAQAVDPRAGGAGLGLYLVATAASALHFRVVPGDATEITCVFDLDDRALAQLSFVTGAARATAPRTTHRRLSGRIRQRRVLAATAGVVALGAVVAGGYQLFGPAPTAQLSIASVPGAQLFVDGHLVGTGSAVIDRPVGQLVRLTALLADHAPSRRTLMTREGDNPVALTPLAVAALALDSQPRAVMVEIDGHPVGSTPLHVVTLAPGAAISIAIEREGYKPVTVQTHVPARGQRTTLVQPLEVDPSRVRIHIVSTPPGAAVVRGDQPPTADRTYTPVDLVGEANQLQHFTLTMPEHAPARIPPFAPQPGTQVIEKTIELPPLAP